MDEELTDALWAYADYKKLEDKKKSDEETIAYIKKLGFDPENYGKTLNEIAQVLKWLERNEPELLSQKGDLILSRVNNYAPAFNENDSISYIMDTIIETLDKNDDWADEYLEAKLRYEYPTNEEIIDSLKDKFTDFLYVEDHEDSLRGNSPEDLEDKGYHYSDNDYYGSSDFTWDWDFSRADDLGTVKIEKGSWNDMSPGYSTYTQSYTIMLDLSITNEYGETIEDYIRTVYPNSSLLN